MHVRTVVSLLTAMSLAALGAAGCGKVKDSGDNVGTPDATPAPDAGQVCTALTPGMTSSISTTAIFGLEILDADYAVTVEFYDALAGTFDLAIGSDSNYSTCVNCFRASLTDAEDVSTYWFQSGGTLILNDVPAMSDLSGSVVDLTLTEVTIEPKTFVSTLVEGGSCLSLGSFPLSVIPPPAPANDTCTGAVAIAISSTITGTTVGSLNDIEEGITMCTGFPQKGGDVSYKVALTAGIAYQFTVTPTADFPDFDSSLALLGPGGAAVCTEPVACLVGADATLGGAAETFIYTPVVSGDFFLIVDSYILENSGDFTVNVVAAS